MAAAAAVIIDAATIDVTTGVTTDATTDVTTDVTMDVVAARLLMMVSQKVAGAADVGAAVDVTAIVFNL